MDRVAVMGPGDGVTRSLIESYLFDGIDHPLRIARPGVGTTNYYYYEVDLAGNVRGLRASGGASLGGYRYSAFGQTLEDTSLIAQPLRWKARWFSPVAGGTYDVRARQWSPELGVFLSIDDFDMHDEKTTLWGWPNQNPVRFIDYSGRGVVDCAEAIREYLYYKAKLEQRIKELTNPDDAGHVKAIAQLQKRVDRELEKVKRYCDPNTLIAIGIVVACVGLVALPVILPTAAAAVP
jgi:RHS repeat-associated protein